ncbi:hypothetical protein P7C70_g6122, partial [Phenoliferia sp. Uapishka_3]
MSTATDKLNNGLTIPVIGLGCWMGAPGKVGENQETKTMVANALEVRVCLAAVVRRLVRSGSINFPFQIQAGYTHFDTSSGYGNEEAVGAAIRESGVPRETLFVTTKLVFSDHGRVAEAFETSLKLLDIDYVDLYLIHWPQAKDPETNKWLRPDEYPTINDTWAQMEKLLAGGKVRTIGVSNFSVQLLERLASTSTVTPAVNQVECHPYHPQIELSAYAKSRNIHLTSYCPLGQYNSPLLEEDIIKEIAAKHDKTPGQVLLSWNVQRGPGGWSAVPKSSNPTRLAQNLATFELSSEEMEAVSKLHEEPGKNKSLCVYPGGQDVPGEVYGWTLEEMGWETKLYA